MEIGEILQKRRKELDMTLQAVAKRMGVSESTISRWESGDIANMKRDKIKLLSEVLGISPIIIMGWEEGEYQEPAQSFHNILEIGKQRFPLFSGIACGDPILMDSTIETYVSVTTDIKADFVLRAKGDSMAPGVMDGDLVFIRSQPMVENGEVAAVAIGDEATLKRFYHYQDSNVVILRPDNPAFQEKVYQGDQLKEVRILGKAIAFQRDVK